MSLQHPSTLSTTTQYFTIGSRSCNSKRMPRQAREIFGICFKNINRTITLTLRKVLGIVFGIIQIYEHIPGIKFSLGNQEVCGRETVSKRRYFPQPRGSTQVEEKDLNFSCLSESHPAVNLQYRICKH